MGNKDKIKLEFGVQKSGGDAAYNVLCSLGSLEMHLNILTIPRVMMRYSGRPVFSPLGAHTLSSLYAGSASALLVSTSVSAPL